MNQDTPEAAANLPELPLAPVSRRQAVVALALGGAGLLLSARAEEAQPKLELRGLEALKKDWDVLEFSYDGESALLVRVPKPDAQDKRPLKVTLEKKDAYLVAFTRTCRHLGCTVPLPNPEHLIQCPCHGSTYRAHDGGLVKGPAKKPLMGLTLALEGAKVFATGRFELMG